MAWLIHAFRESCLQWVIGSFIHCFVVFFIHWFIGSLIHWFLALLIHRFIGSFGHLHGFFHVISSVSQPHFFSRWCASQLHAFAASASQNRLFFPYIYIHSGFKFSKLSPRCGPGTTWYNWCLEIPLKLVLWYSKDEIGWKSCHERVVASCCVANRGPGSTEPVPQLEKNLCTALTEPKHILSKFVEPLYTGTSPSHCASNVSYSSSLSHNWSSTSPHVFCYWKFVWLARTLH